MSQIPPRRAIDVEVDYWTVRLLSAQPDEKMYCARQLVAKKRERGDFPMVQEPMTLQTVDALARQEVNEAYRAAADRPGERHDEQ